MLNDLGIRIRDADSEQDSLNRDALQDATTFGDLLAGIRRQRWPLIVCTALGLGLGILKHVTTPPLYFASSTVRVDVRTGESASEITPRTPFQRNDTSLLNEIQVLRSRQLAEEVAQRLSLHETPAFMHSPESLGRKALSAVADTWRELTGSDDSVSQTKQDNPDEAVLQNAASVLMRDVGIERIGQSFTIDISYVGPTPDLTAAVVNTYAEAYLADHLKANMEVTERMTTWMQARIDELQREIDAVQQRSENLRAQTPPDTEALKQLAQRASNLETLQQTLSSRFETVAIEGSSPVTNGRILSKAVEPKTPAFPKLWQSLAIMTLLGFMAGFVLAVLRESRERAFRVGEEVRASTGKPFLGYVPHFDTEEIAKQANECCGDDLDARAAAKTLASGLFMSLVDTNSLLSETLRNMHSTVKLAEKYGKAQVIGVSSLLAGEGKTTLAANYANLVARSGEQTLLIDLDLHRSGLTRMLQCTSGPGLTHILDGTSAPDEAMRTISVSGLDFLPCTSCEGTWHQNHALLGHSMTALMDTLRKRYSYIVLDLPPLGTVVDAKVMLTRLDRIFLACAWGETSRNLFRDYLRMEPEVANKVLGIVLNKVDLQRLPKFARKGGWETHLEERYRQIQL